MSHTHTHSYTNSRTRTRTHRCTTQRCVKRWQKRGERRVPHRTVHVFPLLGTVNVASHSSVSRQTAVKERKTQTKKKKKKRCHSCSHSLFPLSSPFGLEFGLAANALSGHTRISSGNNNTNNRTTL